MEKYNKQKAILTALLKWVETEFFGIFVFLFFIGHRRIGSMAVNAGRLGSEFYLRESGV